MKEIISAILSLALCAAYSTATEGAKTPLSEEQPPDSAPPCDSEAAWRNSFKNILILNEDNDRFFIVTPEMTAEALTAHIDGLANSKVTHYFMCPNGQRTSYDSKVHEPIWAPVYGKEPTEKWARQCKLLRDRGIDPYAVWIEACRKNGISPWITMRMNDVHFVTKPDYFRNQNFWREHRELWRVPKDEMPKKGAWVDYAFNYKHKETRDFHLALVREIFERYDIDGFETDWMRFGRHLTPRNERNESQYLTDFMREVRKTADSWEKKRGRRIGISARVPPSPELALKNGMDVAAWVREGLVDIVVPSCVYTSGDFMISVNDWKKYLGDLSDKVEIIPSTDNGFTSSGKVKRQPIDLPLLDGWVTAMRSSGADSIYFFNPFYQPVLLKKFIRRGVDEKSCRDSDRRHPVIFRDMGDTPEERLDQLPVNSDVPRSFKIAFGKKPSPKARGKLSVVVGFSGVKNIGGTKEAKFSVKLNGADPIGVEEEKKPEKFSSERAIRYIFPYSAAKDGINTVSVVTSEGEPQCIMWVEIATETPRETPEAISKK